VFITLNNHLRRPNSNARTPRSIIIMSQSSSTAPSSQFEKGISDSQSTVSSGLSSVPSDLFTPTLGSNPVEPEQQESQDPRVPDIFLGKRKARTSIIWNPENGREVEIAGQRRWRCNRCESPASAVLEFQLHVFFHADLPKAQEKPPLTLQCLRLKILSSTSSRCTESDPTAYL
jgi:hypothetical protein